MWMPFCSAECTSHVGIPLALQVTKCTPASRSSSRLHVAYVGVLVYVLLAAICWRVQRTSALRVNLLDAKQARGSKWLTLAELEFLACLRLTEFLTLNMRVTGGEALKQGWLLGLISISNNC